MYSLRGEVRVKSSAKKLGKNWRIGLSVLLVAIVAFIIGYKIIHHVELKTTSALFIGLPMLVGLLIVNLTRTRDAYGMTVQASFIILCLVAPILGEGAICILMAAPLFVAINLLIVFIYQNTVKKYLLSLLICLPFFIGLAEKNSLIEEPELSRVVTETVLEGSPKRWSRVIGHSTFISKDTPFFLNLGFPLPTKMVRDGNQLLVSFDKGGAWQVDQTWEGEDTIRYTLVKDTSKIGSWIAIKDSIIEVNEMENDQVLVRQTTSYYSKVFPKWYFVPFQKLAIQQLHRWALSSWKHL